MNDVLVSTGRGVRRFALLLQPSSLTQLAFAIAASALLVAQPSHAVPYASGVTNSAGTVSFILNEDAGNVTVVFDGGASSSDMGALTKGAHSFSLGASTSFNIVVKKNVPQAWTQISTDDNSVRFFSARGVAVNLNPATPFFGRVYVANAVAGNTSAGARPVGDGIYVLSADQSDALGRGDTASTGGLNFTTTPAAQDGNTPWRIEVGQDDNLYISDFSTNLGTIYRTDPDVTTGAQVLSGQGSIGPNVDAAVHTTIGGSPIVKGSLETGDLTIWAIDGALTGNLNRLMRWDIGAGPLPSTIAPLQAAQPSPLLGANANVTTDNDIAPDGKLFVMQNRFTGTEVGVAVLVPGEGGSTTVFNSLIASRELLNDSTAVDLLRTSRALKVSPDGKKLAVIRDDNQTWIMPITDGIPNLARRELVPTFPATPTLGRDVGWDAAGNLYVLSSGHELLRVWSPGGDTTATTGSDGTFSVESVPLPEITVAATDDLANESAPDTITFTLTRSESLTGSLTVNYTLTGTAINGTDYETNELSVTFGPGETTAAVTITPIDDNETEFSETVILIISPSVDYVVSFPASAISGISDNEPALVTIRTLDGNAYERFPTDTMTFLIERSGDTNSELFVVYEPNDGVAINGVDFQGTDDQPLSGVVILVAGQSGQSVALKPIDDTDEEGDETVTLTLSGTDGTYTLGTPDSATGIIADNDQPSLGILYADSLDTDTSADWVTRFGANNGIYDAEVNWAFDYSTIGVPPAPNSPLSSLGVFVQVNKLDATARGSAGINLYPAGRTFSGNYALRFDMLLNFGTASTTEHALVGLNHSSERTNRVTLSSNPEGLTRGGDGLFVAIETDGSNNREWTAYSFPTPTSAPTAITNRSAASLASVITAPPYAFAGSPGSGPASGKTWAEVELSQNNDVVTLKVNNNVIYSIENTSGFNSGHVMIGMSDQFDSVGTGGTSGNFVIFDNVRVVSLDVRITKVTRLGNGDMQIDFVSPFPSVADDYRLQASSDLSALDWADETSAVITETADGFRCVVAGNGTERFYQIKL